MSSRADGPLQVVARQPLGCGDGFSGNRFERVTLHDGRTLIHKRVDPDEDWISRATGDRGRLVELWGTGALDRIPPAVDHTIVAVEADERGWSVYMRDASPHLLPGDTRLDRRAVRHVLEAMARAHDAFRGEAMPALCSIEDRYHLLSPRTIRREAALGNPAEALERGWEAFHDHAPADVADAVLPLAEDPTVIADGLRTCELTLIHGDLRIGNLGMTEAGVVLLDWGERSGPAPPAVELMWFLGFDALLFDCTREDVLDDFRELSRDRVDDRTMDLALIGGLVHLACHFGLGLLGRSPTTARLAGNDAERRAAAASELDWWVDAVRGSLERVSL